MIESLTQWVGICCAAEHFIERLLDCGCVPVVIAHLQSPRDSIQLLAARMIHNVSRTEPGKLQLMKQDAFSVLVAVLERGCGAADVFACSAVANLCQGTSAARLLLFWGLALAPRRTSSGIPLGGTVG